ncbi:MAG: phage Gp37/Gp68 family protein [Magnetococcales bacterium]|nr:phage Gp37/Gp68 family protein [Magnetococcales bacterium]
MADHSAIEWTEATWNPVTGCTKISAGCRNCYAERMSKRLHAMGNPRYYNGFRTTAHPDLLEKPLKTWRRPRMIFVNSMSDLFHDDVPDDYILNVFKIMSQSTQHTFQVLTKRSARLNQMANQIEWPSNVWMGVTVEDDRHKFRIEHLRKTPSSIRFLSIEPLLGPLGSIDLRGISWVIVGGESGPGARPMQADWATSIRDQCLARNIPFFFKQWGGVRKKAAGRMLEGHVWNQMPCFKQPSASAILEQELMEHPLHPHVKSGEFVETSC